VIGDQEAREKQIPLVTREDKKGTGRVEGTPGPTRNREQRPVTRRQEKSRSLSLLPPAAGRRDDKTRRRAEPKNRSSRWGTGTHTPRKTGHYINKEKSGPPRKDEPYI